MQWYYAKGGEQTGPVEDQAFHELVRSGQITPDTPVWREGMTNWMPYAQVGSRTIPAASRKKLTLACIGEADPATPESGVGSGAAPAGNSRSDGTFDALIEPLYRGRGWMRFLGILMIIQGILMATTIVGLVIAWLPIWLGITLTSGARQMAFAFEAHDQAAAMLAMDKLRLYFKIMGILTLAGLVLGVLGAIAAILFPALLHLLTVATILCAP